MLVYETCCSISFTYRFQVLADEGKAKAIAFDEIDKAPEEKARGITIATVSGNPKVGRMSGGSEVHTVVESGP